MGLLGLCKLWVERQDFLKMSESWQGWVAGGIVLGALVYLVIRFFKPKGGKGSGCGKCSS
jgi:hypothetical protein